MIHVISLLRYFSRRMLFGKFRIFILNPEKVCYVSFDSAREVFALLSHKKYRLQ